MKRQDTEESVPQAAGDSSATEGAMELIPTAVDVAERSVHPKEPETPQIHTPPPSGGSGVDDKGTQAVMLQPQWDLDLHGSR